MLRTSLLETLMTSASLFIIGIGASPGMDRTRISLDALKSNLGASLALYADIVQRPDYPPAEIERVRGQMLTALQQEASNPIGIAQRILGQGDEDLQRDGALLARAP